MEVYLFPKIPDKVGSWVTYKFHRRWEMRVIPDYGI